MVKFFSKQKDTLDADALKDTSSYEETRSVSAALVGIYKLTKSEEEIQQLIKQLEELRGTNAAKAKLLQERIDALRARS